MRHRLAGHLSAYKARGVITGVYSPCSHVSPGFQKYSVIQLALHARYSTGAHDNIRPSRRNVAGSSGIQSSPKARDARSTSTTMHNWLEFDLNDESIPEQVRSLAWRIKVLDIANVVSRTDAERLHKALREFLKARAKPDRQKPNMLQADIATRLVDTFEGVQRRAEKKFQAEAQRDVDELTSEEANLRRDVALALDQLQNLQTVPQDTPETYEHEALPVPEHVKAEESPEPVKVEDTGDVRNDAADAAQKVRLKRFQSENTLAWIQGKKLQHAIAWAEENAQSKLRKFQFYLSGELPHASASDVESAKADYANALERQRLLSLQIGAEEGVIIRHKPARPPPIVIQPQAQPVPEPLLDLPEQMAVRASVTTPPQADRPPASETKAHLLTPDVSPDDAIPDPVAHIVSPVEGPKHQESSTGLFASVRRAYAKVVSALTNPWKTLVQLVKTKPRTAARVLQSSTFQADEYTETPRNDLDTTEVPKRLTYVNDATVSKSGRESGFLRFMRNHQAEANAKAGHYVESTDWIALGYQNYGHWLATRLDKPMTTRESAYIEHLLSALRNSPFIRKRYRRAWQSYIAQLGRDHGRYASEVTDPRINVHLEEILPTSTGGTESSNEVSTSQQGPTWQQRQAVDLFASLQKADMHVLEVHTDGSFHERMGEPSQSGGGIVIKTEPNEIREVCYMGSMMHDPSEAEMGALYRGLQILRDTLRSRGHSRDLPRYQRILVATDSIQVLEALCGYSVWYTELRKMTRIAALCRMEAYDIVKENKDIESIDFVWLPRLTHGNADADQLARAGRLSAFNFLNDDRSSTSSDTKKQ